MKDIRIAKQLSIDDAEVEEDALKSAKFVFLWLFLQVHISLSRVNEKRRRFLQSVWNWSERSVAAGGLPHCCGPPQVQRHFSSVQTPCFSHDKHQETEVSVARIGLSPQMQKIHFGNKFEKSVLSDAN